MTAITEERATEVAAVRLQPGNARSSAAPSAGTDLDLIEIIRKYNEVTDHLKHSHEQLSLEVCRLREALHAKNRELQRREQLAALGEMAAGVAHEVRNPLGGIGIYASLLERDLADRPKERDLCRRIGRGVETLEAVIGDILTFAGDAEPNIAPVSLGDILDSVVVQTEARADAQAVELEVDGSIASVAVACDAHQITRAISNLVFNAMDAVERGGRVRVCGEAVRGSSAGGASSLFHVRVEDNGPGIAPDDVDRVFTPFFTTKHKGTGLGLAIVHRIAEAHHGVVRAGNREGGGAVFVLGVPLA